MIHLKHTWWILQSGIKLLWIPLRKTTYLYLNLTLFPSWGRHFWNWGKTLFTKKWLRFGWKAAEKFLILLHALTFCTNINFARKFTGRTRMQKCIVASMISIYMCNPNWENTVLSSYLTLEILTKFALTSGELRWNLTSNKTNRVFLLDLKHHHGKYEKYQCSLTCDVLARFF